MNTFVFSLKGELDMFPSRYINLPEARNRFGDRVDRLGAFLTKTDPIADSTVEVLATFPKQGQDLVDQALRFGINTVPQAPKELQAFFAELDQIPFWVDWNTIARGGQAFLRTGVFGGTVLACQSLILGYCSPGGNKPLAFTGRLTESAPRRLTETSRFVLEVCRKDGLRRFSEGFSITAKVRLIHAQVRRMLNKSGRWDPAVWGEAINQHDMAGTLLLFSSVALDGLRKFGFRLSQEESESLMHLWRYVGYLLGVEEELLPTTEAEGKELAEILKATSEDPDNDSRALAKALMEVPLVEAQAKNPDMLQKAKRFVDVTYGISRGLVGDTVATQLGYPKTAWRFSVPAFRLFISRAEFVRQRIPKGDTLASHMGTRYWDWVVKTGSNGVPIDFVLPKHLSKSFYDTPSS